MSDVFISYSREDRTRIESLAAALEAQSFSVWWDRDILGGADFSETIERELEAAGTVIAAWSKGACASKWVRDEAAYARDRDKLVPIVLEPVEPPLGFRQIQALDFAQWKGDAEAPVFRLLIASLRRGAATTASPTPSVAPRSVRRRRFVFAGVCAAAVAALVGAALFVANRQTTSDAAGPRLNPALSALGASNRAEERAAYESFVAGDRNEALDILERFARDLEGRGETLAAAEAYTRAASLALLVDQARGLAARQKAFALDPESFDAFQGLFFDTLLTKGPDAAEALGVETAARTDISARLRALAYACLAVLVADLRRDLARAEGYLMRVKALGSGDPAINAAHAWAESVVAWRSDDLARSRARMETAKELMPEAAKLVRWSMPIEIQDTRLAFSSGDWENAFRVGASAVEARAKAGLFIPTPMLFIACRAGLYIGEVERAAPYCLATESYAPGDRKLYAAELAAARGDLDGARAELAAARAIGSPKDAQLALVDARIAAAAGDLEAAQTALWRHLDMVAAEPDAKSRRATALRLYAVSMIDVGATARACAPLAEAEALYGVIGGDAGVAETQALGRKAACKSGPP